MNQGSIDPADGRFLQARRATRKYVKKMAALGFTQADVDALLKTQSDELALQRAEQLFTMAADKDGSSRLFRAQSAIRALLAAGFSAADIADLVDVQPYVITHILHGDYRSVNEDIVLKLEKTEDSGAWWERLKNVVRHIPMKFQDACVPQGRPLGQDEHKMIEGAAASDFVRAIGNHPSSMPAPIHGLKAALLAVGDPIHGIYLLKLWISESDVLKRLMMIEHELEHLLARVRKQRKDLERKSGKQAALPAVSGDIA